MLSFLLIPSQYFLCNRLPYYYNRIIHYIASFLLLLFLKKSGSYNLPKKKKKRHESKPHWNVLLCRYWTVSSKFQFSVKFYLQNTRVKLILSTNTLDGKMNLPYWFEWKDLVSCRSERHISHCPFQRFILTYKHKAKPMQNKILTLSIWTLKKMHLKWVMMKDCKEFRGAYDIKKKY